MNKIRCFSSNQTRNSVAKYSCCIVTVVCCEEKAYYQAVLSCGFGGTVLTAAARTAGEATVCKGRQLSPSFVFVVIFSKTLSRVF